MTTETTRDAKDYAIEFGEYLAHAAENLLVGINKNRSEITDEWKALNSAIYEFRKRASRTL